MDTVYVECDRKHSFLICFMRKHPVLLNLGCLLLFIAFAFLSNWSILLGENLMKWDIWDAEYPAQVLMSDALANHTIPLWNPLVRYGVPYYSVLGTPIWYPVTLVLALIGYTPRTVAVSYAIHVAIGGFGMFLLARKELEREDRPVMISDLCASIAVGLLYCGSGLFLSNAQHIMIIISAAWIPYVFYFVRCFFQKRHIVFMMAAGLCAGLILLGGYPEMFYNLFLLLVLYVFYFNWKKEKKIWQNIVSSAGHFLGICLFTIMAGAIALLPFLHNMGLITRGNGAGQIPNGYSVTVLLSMFFSQMSKILSGYEQSMINCYVGIITVLLIPLIFTGRQLHKKLYFVLFILAFLLCWGENSFLHTFLYRFFPMYDSFRFPTLNRVFMMMFVLLMASDVFREIFEKQVISEKVLRYTGIILIVSVVLATSAALIGNILTENTGLSISKCITFSESAFTLSWILFFYFIIMYAIFHRKLKGSALKISMLVMICVELLTYSLVETPISITRYRPTEYSYNSEAKSVIDNEFKENAERIRDVNFAGHIRSTSGLDSQKIVFNKTFDEEGYLSFLLSSTENFKRTYRRSTMEQNPVAYFTNDLATPDEISYEEWAYKCNVPAEQIYVEEGLETSTESVQRFAPEITGKTQLAVVPIENGVSIDGTLSTGEEKTGRIRIYFTELMSDTVTLNVKFVENENSIASYEDSFDVINSEDGRYVDIFFPAVDKTYQSIQIFSQEALPDLAELITTERMTKDKYTEVLWFGFNSIQMTVEAPTEGYLTLLQAKHDGWKAYVDGQETEIAEVDHCFMGVKLEKGTHTVIMKFRPKEFFAGAGITFLFALAFVIEVFLWRYKYNRNVKIR